MLPFSCGRGPTLVRAAPTAAAQRSITLPATNEPACSLSSAGWARCGLSVQNGMVFKDHRKFRALQGRRPLPSAGPAQRYGILPVRSTAMPTHVDPENRRETDDLYEAGRLAF